MTTDDDRSAELLTRALAEEAATVTLVPGSLQAIQRRTGSEDSSATRRRCVFGSVGGGLAAAAVITAVVLVAQGGDPAETPAAGRPGVGTVHQSGLHAGVYDPNAAPGSRVTLFYVGPRPEVAASPPYAPRLYAETHTVAQSDQTSAVTAVHEFLTSTPIDPDYTSGWPPGVDVSGIFRSNGRTTIALRGDADLGTRAQLAAQPHDGARLAVQALLETAGVDGRADFVYNGNHIDSLFGEDVSPVTALPYEQTRAFVSIDNIVDGQETGNPVTVLVSGNTFEGTVNWQLLGVDGTKVHDGTVTTAMGSWRQVEVHLGALDPGTYTFRALEYSAENGSPVNVDDKTFTVG